MGFKKRETKVDHRRGGKSGYRLAKRLGPNSDGCKTAGQRLVTNGGGWSGRGPESRRERGYATPFRRRPAACTPWHITMCFVESSTFQSPLHFHGYALLFRGTPVSPLPPLCFRVSGQVHFVGEQGTGGMTWVESRSAPFYRAPVGQKTLPWMFRHFLLSTLSSTSTSTSTNASTTTTTRDRTSLKTELQCRNKAQRCRPLLRVGDVGTSGALG